MPNPGSRTDDVARTELRARSDDDGALRLVAGIRGSGTGSATDLRQGAVEGAVVAHGTLVGVVAR